MRSRTRRRTARSRRCCAEADLLVTRAIVPSRRPHAASGRVIRRPYALGMATLTCERCGLPLPDEARFCPNCGYPVGAPPPEERKFVTVIFVDLVGSTQLSSQIDPERYREVLTRYYRMVAEELECSAAARTTSPGMRSGVFGLQHTHDDDALRAVRAGLGLVDRVGRLGEEIGFPVPPGSASGSIRSGRDRQRGVRAGPALRRHRQHGGASPAGRRPGDRARLRNELPPVPVAGSVRPDARGRGEAFQDARAWPVAALQPGSGRRTIPLVNRKRELRLLQDAFDGARAAPRAPGDAVRRAGDRQEPGGRRVRGRSAGRRQGAAGAGEPVRGGRDVRSARADPPARDGEAAHARPGAPRARLEEIVLECTPPEEAKQIVERLCIALGIAGEARDEKRYRVAEIRRGCSRSFAGSPAGDGGRGTRGPAGGPGADARAGRGVGARGGRHPAARDLRRPVHAARRPSRLGRRARELGQPLPGDALARRLGAASRGTPAKVWTRRPPQRIAQHAGGNPFFIIETTGMLLHEEAKPPTRALCRGRCCRRPCKP